MTRGSREAPELSPRERISDSARRQTAHGCQLPAAQVCEPVGEVEDEVALPFGEQDPRQPVAVALLTLDGKAGVLGIGRQRVRLGNSNGRVPVASSWRRAFFDQAANAADVGLR